MHCITNFLLYIAGIAAIAYLIYQIYWLIVRIITINKIPGPKAYPIVGNLLDIMGPSEKLWDLLRNMAAKYYPIYKLSSGPFTAIGLLSPEDIEQLLSSSKHITKSKLYELLEPWLRKGLLTSTGVKWQSRRKILTPAFHFNILQQFLPILTEQSEILINRLEGECDKPFTDLVPVISKFTLNSICETAMGTSLNDNKQGEKVYATCVYRFGELSLRRIMRPWLYNTITYLLTQDYWELRKLNKLLHNFSNSVIEQRKHTFLDRDFSAEVADDDISTKQRLAMLDLLISTQKNNANIDDEGIREEVDTFIFEGHDTTAMSISFTLLLLANNRHIQDKVVEELENIFGDSNRTATFHDLQNMHYLEMVLKESLRMYPSVPLIARVAGEDFRTRTGYTIPKYTNIHIYIYDLHHDPKLYTDPEKFDPDRFLPENTRNRHPYAYIPFSAGPRNCIGQKFAMLELKVAISSILRKFALEPIDKPSDIVLLTDILIRPKYGIKIKFKRRQESKLDDSRGGQAGESRFNKQSSKLRRD